jgi:hypothetical protein
VEANVAGLDHRPFLQVPEAVAISVREIREENCRPAFWVKLLAIGLRYFVPGEAPKRV